MNASIVFDHRKKSGTNDIGTVEIRLTFNRKSYYLSTGVRVLRKNFVAGAIVNQIDCNELNERVHIIFNKVQAEVNRYLEDDATINIAELRRRVLNGSDVNESNSSLIDFIEEQEQIMPLREGTLKHYRTLRMRLLEYGKLKRWSDLSAENICKFDAWLRTLTKSQSDAEKKAKKPAEHLCDAAVYNYHKKLKAILNRAVLFGKIEVSPYDKLRGKFNRGDKESIEFLTEEEMQAVESLHPMEGSQMAAARDLFVFQMHTALSYADTQVFDIKNYHRKAGKLTTIGHRVKTGVEFVIQLSDECEAILERYGWQLPKMINQDYNECLRKIGEALGIEKRMHSHLARHSFGTKMIASDVAIQNVRKMMGHKDIKQTLRYAKVRPESIYADFTRVENLKRNIQ